MSRGATIAPVDAGDAASLERLRALMRAYDAGLPPELRHADIEAELRALEERYADGAMLLAWVDGEAVGCVLLERRDAAIAAVRHLYVDPRARGSGAGRALMEALIAAARARGFARLVLDTHRDALTSAYALYLRLGFSECEPVGEVDYACPTFMALSLGGA